METSSVEPLQQQLVPKTKIPSNQFLLLIFVLLVPLVALLWPYVNPWGSMEGMELSSQEEKSEELDHSTTHDITRDETPESERESDQHQQQNRSENDESTLTHRKQKKGTRDSEISSIKTTSSGEKIVEASSFFQSPWTPLSPNPSPESPRKSTHRHRHNITYRRPIQWAVFLGIFASITCYLLIPQIQLLTLKAGLSGKDLNKGSKATQIPESLGIVTGTVYVAAMCCVTLLVNKREYFAGLFCSLFMLYLGFADDVLDLRWRYKLVLPALATFPLLVAYGGITRIVIPKPFRRLFFNIHTLEMGVLYHVYMWLVAIYCSNAINIYAGINGLEPSQALIIACAVLLHNLIEMKGPHRQAHLFSVVCMIPFILTTIPLLYYNWYPSNVFVGDTFTYFAGMTLAVVGILGHFSKTLMLFFIPQWLNFFYSLPQLFGLVACPRHRLPIFNESTGLLESSGNWTLLNLTLDIFGPLHEESLCLALCVFQIFCCAFGFWVRYYLSKYFY